MEEVDVSAREKALLEREAAVQAREDAMAARESAMSSRELAVAAREEDMDQREQAHTEAEMELVAHEEYVHSREVSLLAKYPFRFLDLLPELRNQIYDLVAMDADPGYNPRLPTGRNLIQITALEATCRQVRSEFLSHCLRFIKICCCESHGLEAFIGSCCEFPLQEWLPVFGATRLQMVDSVFIGAENIIIILSFRRGPPGRRRGWIFALAKPAPRDAASDNELVPQDWPLATMKCEEVRLGRDIVRWGHVRRDDGSWYITTEVIEEIMSVLHKAIADNQDKAKYFV